MDFPPVQGDYKPKTLYLIKEKVFKEYTTRSDRHRWQKLM